MAYVFAQDQSELMPDIFYNYYKNVAVSYSIYQLPLPTKKYQGFIQIVKHNLIVLQRAFHSYP